MASGEESHFYRIYSLHDSRREENLCAMVLCNGLFVSFNKEEEKHEKTDQKHDSKETNKYLTIKAPISLEHVQATQFAKTNHLKVASGRLAFISFNDML
jgi:hypothetical protein